MQHDDDTRKYMSVGPWTNDIAGAVGVVLKWAEGYHYDKDGFLREVEWVCLDQRFRLDDGDE